LYFVGSFLYDTTWQDTDPAPAHGDYEPPALGAAQLNIQWYDGYTCNLFYGCPLGVASGTFVILPGAAHQHSVSISNSQPSNFNAHINVSDAAPGSGGIDVWAVPFFFSFGGLVDTQAGFGLLDLYGANAANHIASAALGVAPSLADFDFGSTIDVSRRQHVCDASVYADAANAGDASAIAGFSYCSTTFVSDLHWTGTFFQFSAAGGDTSVSEPGTLVLVLLGLASIMLGVRARMAECWKFVGFRSGAQCP
jgi:hypothetical protein